MSQDCGSTFIVLTVSDFLSIQICAWECSVFHSIRKLTIFCQRCSKLEMSHTHKRAGETFAANSGGTLVHSTRWESPGRLHVCKQSLFVLFYWTAAPWVAREYWLSSTRRHWEMQMDVASNNAAGVSATREPGQLHMRETAGFNGLGVYE